MSICTCCHQPFASDPPIPNTTPTTRCKTCRHIYRQAARSDTRKVSAMRQETLILKGTFA